MRVVALCERDDRRREEAAGALGAAAYRREMRRRYAAGDIGEVRYAEAEYLDEPADLAAMGVELSIMGIQAMRSSLAGNVPVEVPDLRSPTVRRTHAADDWFPEPPEL